MQQMRYCIVFWPASLPLDPSVFHPDVKLSELGVLQQYVPQLRQLGMLLLRLVSALPVVDAKGQGIEER